MIDITRSAWRVLPSDTICPAADEREVTVDTIERHEDGTVTLTGRWSDDDAPFHRRYAGDQPLAILPLSELRAALTA